MTDNTRYANAYGLDHLDKKRFGKRKLARGGIHETAALYGISYSGDVNCLDHGGYFYRLDASDIESDYVSASRITPDPDNEGWYWIDDLTIILPDVTKERGRKALMDALRCCGWDDDRNEDELTPHHIVEALVSYGTYDTNASWHFAPKDLTENQALNLCFDLVGARKGLKG